MNGSPPNLGISRSKFYFDIKTQPDWPSLKCSIHIARRPDPTRRNCFVASARCEPGITEWRTRMADRIYRSLLSDVSMGSTRARVCVERRSRCHRRHRRLRHQLSPEWAWLGSRDATRFGTIQAKRQALGTDSRRREHWTVGMRSCQRFPDQSLCAQRKFHRRGDA